MREKKLRKSDRKAWRKVGYVPAVAATDYGVWGVAADYAFLAAVTRPIVASTSTSDVMTSGTGAWQVMVVYLDASYVEKTELVNLNGTTDVVMTATDVFRVNALFVVSTGTGLKAAGIITVKNNGKTLTLSSILAGENIAKQIVYTVPVGKTLEIFDGIVSNSAATALKRTTFKIMSNYCNICDMVRINATGPILFVDFQVEVDQSSAPIYFGRETDYKENSLRYPEKTDIVCKVLGVAAGIISATLTGVEY
jgi:hypothetical protein